MVVRYLLLFCLLLTPATLPAKVIASVDQAMLYPGDVAILTIEVEDQSGEPDLAPLGQSFNTLGTSQRRQITIRNGRRSDKTIWHIKIEPLGSGKVIIPPIQVGSEQTQPITLTIKQPSAEEQAQTTSDIFIEAVAETGKQAPFVQQQIRYTVRLFYRLPLLDGEMSDPVVEDAIIERLGEGERYYIRRNGSEYQVFKRRYAIFPEKSGELTIPPIRFQGRVSVNNPRQRHQRSLRDHFSQDDFFNQQPFGQSSRPVRIRSQPITLQIQPQPDHYSGQHWLPSEQLVLKDSWAENPPEFRAGQPVTRTLTIEAKGLAASHIPQLKLSTPDHLRIYPEQPKTESVTDGTWVFGQSAQTFTYIPSKPGRQALPAVELTWWNIATGKQQSAKLPAWQIDVLPPLESDTRQSPAEAQITPEAADKSGTTAQPVKGSGNWLYASMAALIVILLLIALTLHRQTATTDIRLLLKRRTKNQRASILNALQQACNNNDPAATKRYLLQLATEEWPQQPPAGLSELAQRLEEGQHLLQELDHALYAAEQSGWRGEALWQKFQHGPPVKKPSSPVRDDGLELLYPH